MIDFYLAHKNILEIEERLSTNYMIIIFHYPIKSIVTAKSSITLVDQCRRSCRISEAVNVNRFLYKLQLSYMSGFAASSLQAIRTILRRSTAQPTVRTGLAASQRLCCCRRRVPVCTGLAWVPSPPCTCCRSSWFCPPSWTALRSATRPANQQPTGLTNSQSVADRLNEQPISSYRWYK